MKKNFNEDSNNKSVKNFANTYVMASQGVFSMAIFGIIGFFIGYKINKHSVWPAILAVFGVLIGLFSLIYNLIYILNKEEKEKNKTKNIEPNHEGLDEKNNKE